MADRPVIFSAPMVKALLDGRKSQTRRVLKLPKRTHSGGPIYERPDMGGWAATTIGGRGCFRIGDDGGMYPVPERPAIWHQTTGTVTSSPFDVGDRLWVREAHAIFDAHGQRRDDGFRWGPWGGLPTQVSPDGTKIAYYREGFDRCATRWRSPIHMPRWASRLTLTVTDVRVQRLQEISGEDCLAEGACEAAFLPLTDQDAEEAREAFRSLWTSLHGPDAWDANPWICALTFTVSRGNIDGGAA